MPLKSNFIAYLIAPPKRGNTRLFFTTDELEHQEKKVESFLNKHNGQLVSKYVEVGVNARHRNRWPELTQALKECEKTGASLIIAEISTLTNNDAFTCEIIHAFEQMPKSNKFEIFCLDQPFITIENLSAIISHSKAQREHHGKLIQEGLKRAKSQPGNPNAKEAIAKVNRAKTENGVIYALMMMPIIHDYQTRGYSQRKMVDALNEDGFPAPCGGHWVLSQFQKTLHKIKVTESALLLQSKFETFDKKNFAPSEIANQLNRLQIVPPKGKQWDQSLVTEVQQRIDQLAEIDRLNQIMLELLPLFEQYHIDELSEDILIEQFKTLGVRLPGEWLN